MSSEIITNLKIIEPQRLMMSSAGTWPKENASFWYKCMGFTSFFLGSTLTITMWIQMYHCFNDFAKLSEILYMGSTMMSFLVKLYGFNLNKKYVYILLKQVEDLNDEASRDFNEPLRNSYQISSVLTRIYRIVCVATTSSYAVFPLVENEALPFPFPYFNKGSMHYPMYLFQWTSIMFSGWNNASLDVTTVGFMLIAGAQLDVLKQRIVMVVNSGDATEEKLKTCCIHHNKIMNLVSNIQKLFGIGLLAQFCSSIICICNTGFHFMLISWKSTQFVNLCLYFTAMSCQLSMYCWFGNAIILKSEEIRDTCYNSEWYKLDRKLSKYIFLMMERSKRPLTIYAYKLAALSLASFMSILHWSYSYYALLRRLYAKTNSL